MDPTGCSPGMATDRVFMVQGGVQCGDSMALFWGLIIPVLVVRVLVNVLNIRIALHVIRIRKEARENNKKKTTTTTTITRRIPLTTSLETLFTLFILVGLPLWGFNIANAINGGGPALYAIIITPNHISMIPSCLKLVHLGDRIIPKTFRSSLEVLSGSSEKTLSSVRADPILIILFSLLGCTIILQLLFQAIFTTTINPGTSNLWNEIGMGMGGGSILGGAIIYRQTFRVVHYIENVHAKKMKTLKASRQEGSEGSSESDDDALHRAVSALRYRALAFGLSTFASSVLHFCAIIAMPWYLAYILLIVSQVASIGSILTYKPASMLICSCSGVPCLSLFGMNKPQNATAPSSLKSNHGSLEIIQAPALEDKAIGSDL